MTRNKLTAITFLSIIVLFFWVYPNIITAYNMSKPNINQMSHGWQEACNWLRNSTISNVDYYDEKAKPEWGVFSWWDYGYWITREGQRPAICNPGSNTRYAVAKYFISDNYSETHTELVKMKAQYIIIDYLMVTSKFYAIDTLANAPMGQQYLPTKYQQDYIYYDKGKETPVMLNYPTYYKSLVVRLYNFDGKVVDSPGTPVFLVDKERNIKNIYDFEQYSDALKYQQANGGVIAGSDPFVSPIKMNEPIDGFQLVWKSNSIVKIGNWTYPEVKIFEVVK